MEETLNMWRMVRILKNEQYNWAFTKDDSPAETQEEQNNRIVKHFVEMAQRGDEIPVWSTELIGKYISNYLSEYRSWKPKKANIEKINREYAKGRSILHSCKEKGFVKYEKEDNGSRVLITLAGKKFSEPLGLLKEWIDSDIGPLKSIGLAVLAAVGAVHWDWVVSVTGLISPWW